MIIAIRSSLPSFKDVKFSKGFNVILAERTKESTEKDSRNGLGKTTLIEIIQFCLGATSTKNKGLLVDRLLGIDFHLDLDMNGQPYTFSRNTSDPTWINVEGDWSRWPIKPETDASKNKGKIKYRDFRVLLAYLFFRLPPDLAKEKYTPTFGSLSSYFIRKGRDAFSSPFEHYRKQLTWDSQVNNAFLLGLDWRYAQQWQQLRDREKLLAALKSAASPDLLPNLIGSIGELETEKVRLQEKVDQQRQELHTFKVHPQYAEIEEEASSTTFKIHELNNHNFSDRKLLDYFHDSLTKETPPDEAIVVDLYKQAGIALPDRVIKSLEEVNEFHAQVVLNRRNYLDGEINRLKSNIRERESEIKRLSNSRAKSMDILQTHGALEEYSQLQQRHAELIGALENLEHQIENLRRLEKEKSSIRIEAEQLHLSARSDMNERKASIEKAISYFNENSEALYEAPGSLIIDINKSGYKFSIEIQRAASQGVEQMKVFCYDLMLAQLWSDKKQGLGFLIHDSTLFDGVDERQVAHSLELAARSAENNRYQYICALNSDSIPSKDFSESFDFEKYIALTLTDSTEEGSLLGLRF